MAMCYNGLMERDDFAQNNNGNFDGLGEVVFSRDAAEAISSADVAEARETRRMRGSEHYSFREEQREEFQEALDRGESKAEIMRGIERPVDSVMKSLSEIEGYDTFGKACEVRFDFDRATMNAGHYKRILSIETGMGFYGADKMEGGDYRQFLERFPTFMEFEEGAQGQRSGEEIFAEVKQKLVIMDPRTGEPDLEKSARKQDEYQVDFEKFKRLMFGEQVEAWDVLKDMEAAESSKALEASGAFGASEIFGASETSGAFGVSEIFEASGVSRAEKVAREPLPIGAELGNGYVNASVHGFKTKAEAYEEKLDNEDVVYHDGEWYIAVRE